MNALVCHSVFKDRVDAGMPTALAVSAMIAIGTSHGLVLVFGKSFQILLIF